MTISSGMETAKVAVIGYAARLPGARNASEFWDTLVDKRCEVGEITRERWSDIRYFDPDPAIPGKSYVMSAGVIDRAFEFDAGYFGLTPREAEQMDPQQRILLETVAHAFGHAGLDPTAVDKARTGVFVGASSSDHSTTCFQDPEMIDAQYMLGNTLSIISNRISYHWDFRGPSYTVDTACSSGLFALDQARRAIERGEVDTAVVGSVNMLLSPMAFIGFSKASMLSPTGLCHAFGKEADGYVRSEGAVVFILRNEKLARASGDRVLSHVVATGTNSDGRTPGIAMPSSQRQYDLLEGIKSSFHVDPNDLAFIEAHGTGTAVGDPEEASAIGKAYGQLRSKPLPIGSAKTNVGHLEPAAGLVGLLKAQMALEHGVLPASLHSEELNPNIPFAELGLEVAREPVEIEESDRPWLAAVNSFGFGGANAHAILQQVKKPVSEEVDFPRALILSAESGASLRDLATEWRQRVDGPESDLARAIVDANHRCERHRERLTLRAGSPERLAEALDEWLAGENTGTSAAGSARKTAEKIGFVFSGNGSQWAGMGRYMLLRNAAFRKSFGRANKIALELGAGSLLEAVMSVDLEQELERAPVAQPLLLAVQMALVDALAEEGIRPAGVLGHSAGEVAAAYAAGAITMEEAVRIIVARSATLDDLFGDGTMAALSCSVERAEEVISGAGLDIDIAAENSSESITVSGRPDDITHLLKLCRKNRIAGRKLAIDYAYHSHQVDALKSRLIDELVGIEGRDADVRFYSGCKGGAFETTGLDQNFWWENARERVNFRSGVAAMADDGISLFLEISPKSVLLSYVKDTLEETGQAGIVLGGLEETNSENIDAQSIAMKVLSHGGDIDEGPLLGAPGRFHGGLPSYPFSRSDYRMKSDRLVDHFGRQVTHQLLGGRLHPDADVWISHLSVSRVPWLADHVVRGRVLVPATAFIEMFLSAAKTALGKDAIELRNFEILRPIQLQEHSAVQVRVSFERSARRLTLEMRSGQEWAWVAGASVFDMTTDPERRLELAPAENDASLYEGLKGIGLEYGESFARVVGFTLDEHSADVHLDSNDAENADFVLDPRTTDAALHGVLPLIQSLVGTRDELFVPGHVERIRFYRTAPLAGARLELKSGGASGICMDVTLVDQDGAVVAEFESFWLRQMQNPVSDHSIFWDEVAVPVRTNAPPLDIVAAIPARGSEDHSTDVEVLRDTIGSRLAWDIVVSGQTAETVDLRYEDAVVALEAFDLVSMNSKGELRFKGECPWPDVQTLLNLLIEISPDSADEIRAVLHGMTSDRKSETPGFAQMRHAVLATIRALDLSDRRVLLLGRVDSTVVNALVDAGAFVVIATEKATDLEGLRLLTDGIEHVHTTTLEDAKKLPRFDAGFGVEVADQISSRAYALLPDLAARGTQLVLFDHAVDVFEKMTGGHPEADRMNELADAFVSRNASVEVLTPKETPQVVVRLVKMGSAKTATPSSVDVRGEGAFADQLRAASAPDEPASATVIAIEAGEDIVSTLLLQSEAAREAVGEASAVWLVQQGLEGAAALRGWRRVVANETGQDIRCLSVAEDVNAEAVLDLVAHEHEREITLTSAGAMAHRIVPSMDRPVRPGEDEKAVLSQGASKTLDALHWAPKARRAPEVDEVEVAVSVTGLNFRDVMWAQGALPGDLLAGGFAGASLGMECSGVVARAGRKSGFKAGDRVLAFSQDAFSSHVTVTNKAVVALPDALDLDLAASVPVIFVTADYSLTELARLDEDEWCLIHGGAGGVGQAAIQVARKAGAKIVATAGSEEKRALLRALGVEHVLDSRSLSFAEDIRELTGGRGVDVVLNSLAGEAMEQSIACLAPFGRFIELGKRDFAANTSIGLRPMKNNISYFGVDADQLLRHRPKSVAQTMQRIVEAFQSGDYKIPPLRIFPPEMVKDAFKQMQNSGHVGKILVRPPTPAELPRPTTADLGSTWLIAGGTRGFGLSTARYLAGQGVRNLWLVSRGGKIADKDALADFAAAGVTVNARAVDLTDVDAASTLLSEVNKSGQGLDGVVCGAAVFDDAFFADTDSARLEGVIGPKVVSAQVLDTLTRRFDVSHFWLYSSVSCRFGNPGQAAYVAANMELEDIAQKRSNAGLPALAIAWGPISDAGYLETAQGLKGAIERKLGKVQTTAEAFASLDEALSRQAVGATLTIAPVQWSRLKGELPVLSEPLFECLGIPDESAAMNSSLDIVSMLADKGAAKTRKAVLGLLTKEVAQIIRLAPSEIDVDRELVDMGLDSLMGMNLKMTIEERLGMTTPMSSVGDGLTLNRLAHAIVSSVETGDRAHETETMAERHLGKEGLPEHIKDEIANAATL